VIDLCGEPVTGGTGLQNLRECIQWAEQKFNFEPKLKKVSEDYKLFSPVLQKLRAMLIQIWNIWYFGTQKCAM
jgi:hypothetical protein